MSGRWDKKDVERVNKNIDSLFKSSLIFSCGFFAGMALVIFFG